MAWFLFNAGNIILRTEIFSRESRGRFSRLGFKSAGPEKGVIHLGYHHGHSFSFPHQADLYFVCIFRTIVTGLMGVKLVNGLLFRSICLTQETPALLSCRQIQG